MFFLMSVGYLSFGMFLSYLVKRGTLTILIYFLYVLILEPILMLIHVYYIRNESRNYWPMNTIEDLHPNPMLKLPNFFVNNDWKFSILLSQTTAISMTLVYIAIFLGLSYWIFMKRDV
jgi:ABC-type transport system involved in multi-copper enzyme maturation permease subunit